MNLTVSKATLLRGTNRLATANHELGRFQVVGIPSPPNGTPKVEVTFAITEKQISVSTRDLTHRNDLEIRK